MEFIESTSTLPPPIVHEARDGGLGYDDILDNPWTSVTAQVNDWEG